MAISKEVKQNEPIYCLLMGTVFINRIERTKRKIWHLHLYSNKKGRQQGLLRQAREYPGSDFLALELTLKELIERAKLITAVPRNLPVDYDIKRFLREKQREQR